MTRFLKSILFLGILLLICNSVHAQFSGSNIFEFQYGQIPKDMANFSSGYNRTLAAYTYKDFKANVTLEQYYTPYNERNYTKLTQYSLQYNSKILDLKLGNFQETIGRGLLLRSFEIPGAILEDLSYRSRYYFQRDILGFSGRLNLKNSTTKIIYGKPLNNLFPPNLDNDLRRSDEIKAIYSDYNFKKQTAGLSVLNLNNNSGNKLYGMTTISGSISPTVSYFIEAAKEIGNGTISDFSSTSSHAYYGNVNLTFANLGFSLEAKDYNKFLLGAGINEPPALIKQHSYRVLNRSTHVAQPQNESGYQIEAFYTFPDNSLLTLNHALAINDVGIQFKYKEYFAEYSFDIQDKHDVRIFLDYANDPLKSEKNRISIGTYFDWKAFKKSSIKTEFEFQTFDRNGANTQNYVFLLGYAFKSKYIINLVTELSNDSFLTSSNLKYWIGTNMKYQINSTNNLQLFVGQRRGGPACNAGICYEVLDFKGAELRYTARF
jgi:hypothetical protein